MKSQDSGRIKFLFISVVVFALVIIGKLYFVQIVNGSEFKSRADRQYVQSSYDYFDRGTIYFRSKDGTDIPAATLKSGFIVAINPKIITNGEEVYSKLSNIIELSKEDFFTKLQKKDDPYEEVATRITQDKADQISALKIKGVQVSKERWRYYPGESMAAHALGFIAFKEDELAGRYGLERYYEDVLSRNNDSVYVNFFAEIFSNIKKSLTKGETLEGDIVTTIEPSVQAFFEQKLSETNNKWSSEYTGGIIMDPTTGAIYALGIHPTFDPNNLKGEKNSSVFSNHLVENVYEMGSIIKPLTMAAGLDSGAVTANTTYYDTGTVTLNNKTFGNYDGKARGTVDMQEVLNKSLNVGAAYVVKKMGKEEFAKYMFSFGIDEETGIDLPNETHGLTSNLESPRDIEYATASYGQGIAITPIETVRALAALGNGGYLVNPHLVQRVNYKIGGFKNVTPNPPKQVLKKETSEEISRMLVTVVDKALRDGKVKIPNYSVAAKTGTAQMAKENGRGYYEDRYLHSFFGYFPAFEPRFIVFLYTVYPKGVQFASETLTDTFIDVTKFLINYYEIPPDR